MDPIKFFRHPLTPGQKQYEALRACYIDNVPGRDVARRYGYTYAAVNSLKQKFKADKLKFSFTSARGPKGPRLAPDVRESISICSAVSPL